MSEVNPQPKSSFIPGKPVLFIAAGRLAIRGVDELCKVAASLRLRVSGPFGIVHLQQPTEAQEDEQDAPQQQLYVHDRLPWDPPGPITDPPQGQWDDRLRSLVRRLMRSGSTMPNEVALRRCLQVYTLIDLRAPESAKQAIETLRKIREESVGFDVTAILMTGRSAEFHKREQDWRQGKDCVERANREKFLFHRIYLMDGKNAHQYWLQSEDDHARMAAEYMLHHGLSPYSNLVRRHEAGRFLERQPVEEVCGSFCCRTLHSDRDLVARATTEVLYERLFEDQRKILQPQEFEEVEKIADEFTTRLHDSIRNVGQDQSQPEVAPGPQTQSDPLERKVKDDLGVALGKVCQSNPIGRIPAFLDLLLEKTSGLKMHGVIREEKKLRSEVVDEFRKALMTNPPVAEVEVPKRTWFWYVAVLCFVLGLAVTVVGLVYYPVLYGVPVVIGLYLTGMCLLENAASRKQFKFSSNEEQSPGEVTYRRKLNWNERFTGLFFAFVGTVALLVSVAVGQIEFTPRAYVFCGVAAIVTAAGFMFLLWRAKRWTSVRSATRQPANVAGVRPNDLRVTGATLLIAVLVWVTLFWPVTLRADPSMRVVAGLGLVLCAAGMIYLSHPRGGKGLFLAQYRVSLGPFDTNPPPGDLSSKVDQILDRLHSWCGESQSPGPAPPVADFLEYPAHRQFGTILDAVAGDWPEQLATKCQEDEAVEINDSSRWLSCLLKSFDRPESEVGNYRFVFAHHTVSRWLDRHSWPDLVAKLGKSDSNWLTRYFELAVVPLWPESVRQWDQDVGVAAVDRELLALLDPHAERRAPFRVVPVDWPEPGTIVLVRRVQGTPDGLFGDGLADDVEAGSPDGNGDTKTQPNLTGDSDSQPGHSAPAADRV